MPRNRLGADVRSGWERLLRRRHTRVRGRDWAELRARRIFVLPTRAGWGFAGLLLVLLVGAINYANNLIFVLCFLLAGLGLVTMLHAQRNLARIQLRTEPGRAAFVGEELRFRLAARPGDGRARYALEFQLPGALPVLSHVDAAETRVELSCIAARRGPQPLGTLTVGTCFPLGLFYAWSYLEFEHTELVYPAPAAPGPDACGASGNAGTTGDSGSGSDEYHGVRAYRPGDSPRHIHWKALARDQGLLTKEFGGAGPVTEECWLDFASTPEHDTEARLRRLCRWVLDAERRALRYGLRLPGTELAPASGSIHRDRCLAALATFGGGA